MDSSAFVRFLVGFEFGLGGFFGGAVWVVRLGFGNVRSLKDEFWCVSSSLFAGEAAGVGEFLFVFFAGLDSLADFVFDIGARARVFFARSFDNAF